MSPSATMRLTDVCLDNDGTKVQKNKLCQASEAQTIDSRFKSSMVFGFLIIFVANKKCIEYHRPYSSDKINT